MGAYEDYVASLEGGLPEKQADSLLDKTLGVLSLPRRGVEKVFTGLTGIDIPVSAGTSLREAVGYAPSPEDTIPSRLAGTAIQFAGDIAADPLTYAGIGLAGKAAKVLGAREALTAAEPLKRAMDFKALAGIKDIEELKNITMGMGRFLPEIQLGADVAFGTAAGIGAAQSGSELLPKLIAEGITPETAELAAHTALAGSAAALPILQYKHLKKDQANWAQLRESMKKAEASVTPATYPVNAPAAGPRSPYDFVPPPEAPRTDIPGYGQEVPIVPEPANFLDLLTPEQRAEPRPPLPPPAPVELPGYGGVEVNPIDALADKIVSGARDFSPEELQLQQNYPAELEQALSARRPTPTPPAYPVNVPGAAPTSPFDLVPPPAAAPPAPVRRGPTVEEQYRQRPAVGPQTLAGIAADVPLKSPGPSYEVPPVGMLEEPPTVPPAVGLPEPAPRPPVAVAPPRRPPTPRPEQVPAEPLAELTGAIPEPEGPIETWRNTDLGQAFIGLLSLIKDREATLSTKELDQLAGTMGLLGRKGEGYARSPKESNQRYAAKILDRLGIEEVPQVTAKYGKSKFATAQGGAGYQAAWEGAKEAARLLKQLWTRRTRAAASPEVRQLLEALEADAERLTQAARRETEAYLEAPTRESAAERAGIVRAGAEAGVVSKIRQQAEEALQPRRGPTAQELFEEGGEEAVPQAPITRPVRPLARPGPALPPTPEEVGAVPAPGRIVEEELPQPGRLDAEGRPVKPVGREFSQAALEEARQGGEFEPFPQQRPRVFQRAEIDPKVAAMFEGADAQDFLRALRESTPRLPSDVERVRVADRFNNALTNFLRLQDWKVPEKLTPKTPIRMGSREVPFGSLVDKWGQDRAEFIAAFQRFATSKKASAAARLEEAAGGLGGRDVARRAAAAEFTRTLALAKQSAAELGEELTPDHIARIKKDVYSQYGLGTKVELDRPITDVEGKATTAAAQLASPVDYSLETVFRGADADDVDTLMGLAKNFRLTDSEFSIVDTHLRGKTTLADLVDKFNLTPTQVINRFASGMEKIRANLAPIAKHGDIAKYVRQQGRKGEPFNPVVESISETIAKATNKKEIRNVLVVMRREELLAYIDKLENSPGAVGRLDMLAQKLGFNADNAPGIFRHKPNAIRKARELRKALGIEKKEGGVAYGGLGAVEPAIGAIANLIRRLVRGSEGTVPEMEGIAQTVAETAPTFKTEPTTAQIDAAYGPPRPVKQTIPSPRRAARAKGVAQGAINTVRLGLDETDPRDIPTIQVLQDMAEVSGTLGRTTFKEMNEAADKLVYEKGYDAVAADVSHKLTEGYAPGPAQAVALRRLVLERGRLQTEAREQAQLAAATGDVNVMREASQLAHDSLMKLSAISGLDFDVGRITGQALQSRKMVPENVAADVRGRFKKQITNDPAIKPSYVSAIMDAYDGFMKHRTEEYAKAFHTALVTATKRDWWDMFSEAYRSWLIGPASHIANAASNTIQIGVNTALKQSITPAIDKLIAKKTGQRSIYAVPAHMQMEAMAGAIREAWPTVMKDFGDAIMAREYVPTPEDLISDVLSNEMTMGRYGGAIPNPEIMGKKVNIGEFGRTSLKLLSVGDAFAKHIIRAREMMQHSWTYAKNQAKAQHLPDSAVEGLALQRLRDLVEWRNEKLTFQKLQALKGTQAAKTLQQELSKVLTEINGKVQKEVFQEPFQEAGRQFVKTMKYNPVLRYVDTLVLPFKQTPWNIAAEAIAYSPVGGLKRLGQLQFGDLLDQLRAGKVSQEQVAHELAKSAFGTAVMGAMFYLASSDLLTGGGPVDPRQQALKRQTGWQPYSINIGAMQRLFGIDATDEWVSYQRLEPFSSLFGFASDMAEGVKQGDFDKATTAAQRMTGSLAENLTNKTMLSGMEGIFTMFHDPKQYMGRFVKQLQGSLVPNVIGPVPFGSLGRAMDPLFRQTEAFTTSPMQAKIPFAAEKLLPQVGPSGEVRMKPGESVLERLVSPFARSKRREGAMADAADILNELGYAPSLPPKEENISGRKIPLTDEEKKIYMQAHEQAAERVARIAKDPTFLRLPKDLDYVPAGYKGKTQKSILERVYSEFRQRARNRVREMIYRRKGVQ